MKKRSSNLRLTLMAVAMPIGLAACESEPTGVVLNSIDDCRSQQVDVAQCETAYRDAVAKHAQVAPRYEDAMQCESDFGSCQPVRDEGRTYYSPPMGGFLLGYALAGGFSNTGARQVAGGAPLYRDYRGGGYRNAGGDAVSRQTGPVTGKRGSIATPARAITVSRAGFGSRAAARGTFGSRGGS